MCWQTNFNGNLLISISTTENYESKKLMVSHKQDKLGQGYRYTVEIS
jgi:hypothetical protein